MTTLGADGDLWMVAGSLDVVKIPMDRNTSTSEWKMTLFAMASFTWIVPFLSLCILDPLLKFTHYFRWLNAKET